MIEWPAELFVADPAVILTTVDRLQRKGGREIVGRCLERDDAANAAEWIVDRISRLEPGFAVSADVEPGGGQYLVVLEPTAEVAAVLSDDGPLTGNLERDHRRRHRDVE